MAYTSLENLTANPNLTTILTYPSIDTPAYYPILLFVFFFVFTSLSFFKEVAREGKGNIYSSLVVGSFITTLIATVMSLIGMIGTTTLVTMIVGTILIIGIWMFTNNK